MIKRIFLFISFSICYLSSNNLYADAEDFIGTFTGTTTVTFTGCGPGNDGTFSSPGTIENGFLEGDIFSSKGTNTANPSNIAIVTLGRYQFSAPGVALGIEGVVQNAAGDTIGIFTSATFNFNDETGVYTVISTGDLGGGCMFSATDTGSKVTGSNVIIPETAPSSSVTESVLFNTQIQSAVNGISNRVAGALSALGASFRPSFTDNGFSVSGATGLNAGDHTGVKYGVWGNYSYANYENDLSSTAFDGNSHGFLGGLDFQIWENTVLGVAVGFETADIDTIFNDGNQDADTITIAPYFGAVLDDMLSVDFSIGYSRVDYDQFRTLTGARITSSPEADRWFGTFNLNMIKFIDNWILGARTGMLYANSKIDQYTESDNTIIPDSNTSVGTLSVGGDIAYSYGNFEPFINMAYRYDIAFEEITVTTGPQPSNDKDDILLTAGVRYFEKSGLSGNIEYSKRLLREDYDEDRISLTVRVDF